VSPLQGLELEGCLDFLTATGTSPLLLKSLGVVVGALNRLSSVVIRNSNDEGRVTKDEMGDVAPTGRVSPSRRDGSFGRKSALLFPHPVGMRLSAPKEASLTGCRDFFIPFSTERSIPLGCWGGLRRGLFFEQGWCLALPAGGVEKLSRVGDGCRGVKSSVVFRLS